MYTNEKRGLGLRDLIVKILFFIAFIALIIYLFPTTKDLTPFYTNQFRENISYMQDAARSYFTTEKLPTEVGKSVKLTLKEMLEQKLVLPFVDKDGNSCHAYESYAEVTKEEKGYKLKVQLTCNQESDYLVEILGCYDYGCDKCCGDKCEASSSSEIKKTALEYEFKRNYEKEYTGYTCPSGYTLEGKYCYKTNYDETINATKNYTKSYVKVVDAKYTDGKQEKVLVDTIKTVTKDTKTKNYVPYIVNFTAGTSTLVPLGVIKNTTGGEAYPCPSSTSTYCETTYSSQSYSCDCVKTRVNGKYTTTCSTCYSSVPVQNCYPVTTGGGTCYTPTSTSYSCPDGTTSSTGSGSSLQCFRTDKTSDVTTYTCPADSDGSEGEGINKKCYKLVITKGKTEYSCPSTADVSEGKDENLKCYKYTNGEKQYYCEDGTYKLDANTHKCTKEVTSKFSHYSCPDESYTLTGDKCTRKSVDKIDADTYTYTKSYSETKWSRSKTLWGWTATGRTRIVEVK